MPAQENTKANVDADDKKDRPSPIRVQDLIDAGWGSKNTIYSAIKRGQIKTFRIGGNIIIDPTWASENMGW
jgi:hypothetical protein